jgi:site-specific DNA-cytosine methylase
MPDHPTCIELFAGAGGASLGLHRAGFRSLLAAEWDADACTTHREAALGPVWEGDVRELDTELNLKEAPTLMWASPPCQAFSSAGNRLGALDERNGWPWTLDIIDKMAARGVKPTWIICENVPGLTFHRADCTRDEDSDPTDCPGCYWEKWIIPEFGKRYAWHGTTILDAADFGVPQRRRRVFLVCGPRPLSWPDVTHSFERLVYDKWVSGDYWKTHGLQPPGRGPSPAERKAMGVKMAFRGPDPGVQPWATVRDALGLGAAIRTEAVGAVSRTVDDAAPTVPTSMNIYTAPREGETRTSDFGIRTETRFLERNSGQRGPSERSMDIPAPTVQGGSACGSYDRLQVEEVRLVDQGLRRSQGLDEPAPTVRAGGGHDHTGKLAGGKPHYLEGLREHPADGETSSSTKNLRFYERNSGNRGLTEKSVDEPSPSVIAGSHRDNGLRIEELLEHPDAEFASQGTADPKHPAKSVDEPATAIRAGGDGHSSPNFWVQAPQEVFLRQESTASVARTVDEPSHPVATSGMIYVHGDDPGTRAQKQEGEVVIHRQRGKNTPGKPRRDHPLDEPSPTVEGGEARCGPRLEWRIKGTQDATPDDPSPTVRAGGNVDATGKLGGGAPPYLADPEEDTPEDDDCDVFGMFGVEDEPEPHKHLGPGLVDEPCRAVSATEAKGCSAIPEKRNRASDDLYLSTGRRRLTIEECAILQGFPVDYPFQGTSTSRYRQVGNAVAPPVAEALGKALLRS